ncbi:MAG: lysylphosphatidylglycerol synthase transmembrane domain-containing protein [Pseudomonadota bacterium]|nr:lysylphosphatidylglycerol synthase transmembrane domain-containing protein [Pseudomonadota bacterium]
MGRFQKPIILSLIAAIGLYFGAMFLGDFKETGAAIAELGAVGWLVILLLSLVNYGLRYWRWEWYLTKLSGSRIPHRRHLAYYVSGFALSTTPGKAGETVRSLYLKQHDVSFNHTLSTFFVERFQDLLTIVLMASAAAFLFEGYGLVVALTAIVVLGSLPLLHSPFILTKMNALSATLSAKPAKLLQHLLDLLNSSAVLLKNKELLGGILIGITAWMAEGVGFWYLLVCLGQDVQLVAAVSIYGVAVLVGAISFLPGGLGSTEAVMGLLLIASGVPEPVAIAATLICRIATLWFAVFIGLIVAGILALNGIVPISGKEVTDLG